MIALFAIYDTMQVAAGRRVDRLHRPGGVGRRGDPGRRRRGQALRPAQRPGAHPPAPRRRPGPVGRHRDPGPRDGAAARAHGRGARRAHRPDRSSASAPTSTATTSSAARRRSPTAWSTTSSRSPPSAPWRLSPARARALGFLRARCLGNGQTSARADRAVTASVMAPFSAPCGEPGVLGEDAAWCSGARAASSRPCGAASSASSTIRSIVWPSTSMTMRSPSRDERDRAAVDRLGRDVADAEAVGAAGEPAVGDERGVAAAAGALHRAGDGEHLAHARAALRALVADDDDVAGLDLAGEDRLHRRRLAVEHPGRCPRSASKSMPATFTTAPFGASEPRRTAMPPTAWIGSRQRVHDLAVGRRRVEGGEVLGHRLAGDGEAVAVEQPGVEQLLHHDRHAADRGRGRSCGTCRAASCRRCAAPARRPG